MPKDEKARIRFNGRTIDFTIVRSARRKKTIEITLDPERGVLVRSPARTSRTEISDLVRERAAWILSKAHDGILHPKPRSFTDGESLHYLGKEIPIVCTTGEDAEVEIDLGNDRLLRFTAQPEVSVQIEEGAFHITVPADLSAEEGIAARKKAVETWYRKEAARLLPEVVARWQSKVSRERPTQVLIRSQRRRWGSCSSDGSIRLNWRIIMAEPALIDYVVVHELAHLAVMDHSPRFWKQVERAIPDYRVRRKRLNEVGARFWF